jgi:hypothetical protein
MKMFRNDMGIIGRTLHTVRVQQGKHQFSQQRISLIFVMKISSNQSLTAVSGGFLDILKLFREPNYGFINQFQRFGLSTKPLQFKRAIYQ